uniref:(northern house mosquito) hypothetical protein n=1 Tax=Culex pipiens TaxID=7175 RepID=A0A8D8C407_CULPI
MHDRATRQTGRGVRGPRDADGPIPELKLRAGTFAGQGRTGRHPGTGGDDRGTDGRGQNDAVSDLPELRRSVGTSTDLRRFGRWPGRHRHTGDDRSVAGRTTSAGGRRILPAGSTGVSLWTYFPVGQRRVLRSADF